MYVQAGERREYTATPQTVSHCVRDTYTIVYI